MKSQNPFALLVMGNIIAKPTIYQLYTVKYFLIHLGILYIHHVCEAAILKKYRQTFIMHSLVVIGLSITPILRGWVLYMYMYL